MACGAAAGAAATAAAVAVQWNERASPSTEGGAAGRTTKEAAGSEAWRGFCKWGLPPDENIQIKVGSPRAAPGAPASLQSHAA